MRRCSINGLSLLELVIALGVITVLAAMLIPLLGEYADADRSGRAYNEMVQIYTAIVGTPATGNFGYLGDVGDYPTHFNDLLRSNGAAGWNGPYLSGISDDSGVMTDPWGDAYEYYYAINPTIQNGSVYTAYSDYLAIISKGPDHTSTNTSATPNIWATYAGTPLPSSAAYYSTTGNPDNVLYPAFPNSSGLLSYNNVGQLNLNVFSYDSNPNVSAYVTGCPNMFEIKITPLRRPAEVLGSTPGTAPKFNKGAASFDLIQGIYRVELRLGTTPYASYWDETLAIAPSGKQSRTINVQGPDSSSTGQYYLYVENHLSTTNIAVYNGSTLIGSAAGGGTSNFTTLVRGCSPITVRNSTTNEVLDSFIMPVGLSTTYSKYYNDSPTTYTLVNSGSHRHLLVYANGLFIGQVGKWGNAKAKVFSVQIGDSITITDESNNPLRSVSITGGTPSDTL